MALVACKECGKMISEQAATCPNCGISKPIKRSKIAVTSLIIAIFIFILALTINGSEHSNTVSNNNSTPKEEEVDYFKPLYTTRGAVICPQGLVLDLREGYGLEALKKASHTLIGRKEAFAKLGCATYQAGIPISLTTEERQRASEGKSYITIEGTTDFILLYGLTNKANEEQASSSSSGFEQQPITDKQLSDLMVSLDSEKQTQPQLKIGLTTDIKAREDLKIAETQIMKLAELGIINKAAELRSDYTDMYRVKIPTYFLNNEVVVIENSYMTKWIGCCPQPGMGIFVKVLNDDNSKLEQFGRKFKCSVDKNQTLKDAEYVKLGIRNSSNKEKYTHISCSTFGG
ncbi:zinc ribbon domain-containing protein [Polynucleobacter sp. P1-05-14]|uniref:zinc ribbon domain-containing protein n=1 Tax=Polynucleobacter sp. P1-05-14 TaxID=1819732 RepID=UPI001C0AECB1|nr:zinc ribbon domain-containing protein [Polynucleobacter sp. P1-05-14]MBU3547506.1 zinc ribbon domain-containing protein [Polynucleobacter sp. P1-05-14]